MGETSHAISSDRQCLPPGRQAPLQGHSFWSIPGMFWPSAGGTRSYLVKWVFNLAEVTGEKTQATSVSWASPVASLWLAFFEWRMHNESHVSARACAGVQV